MNRLSEEVMYSWRMLCVSSVCVLWRRVRHVLQHKQNKRMTSVNKSRVPPDILTNHQLSHPSRNITVTDDEELKRTVTKLLIDENIRASFHVFPHFSNNSAVKVLHVVGWLVLVLSSLSCYSATLPASPHSCWAFRFSLTRCGWIIHAVSVVWHTLDQSVLRNLYPRAAGAALNSTPGFSLQ